MMNRNTTDTSALWARKAGGCAAARRELIERHRGMVPRTRERTVPNVPPWIDPEDLIGEGFVALTRAVDQFDPARGIKFTSYAIAMIRGGMLEMLRRQDWVPRSVRDRQKLANTARSAVEARYGPQGVTDARWAQAAGVADVDAWYALYAAASVLQVASLEDVMGDGEQEELDPLVLASAVKGKDPDPSDLAAGAWEREALHVRIGWLPVMERTVIQAYYFEGLTLKQIARDLGRSESRAHQLHARGIERLRGFTEGVCCAA